MPSTVLGVEITKLNLSPFFSPLPSLWVCTNSCLFLPGCGETALEVSARSLFRVQRKCWGWGPQSDFIELDVSLVGIYHVSSFALTTVSQFTEFILNTLSFSVLLCFSPGILEVTFVFGGVTDGIMNLREMGTGRHSVYQWFSNLFIGTQGKTSVLHQDAVHTFVHADVWFPEIIPLLYVNCDRVF